MGRGRRGREIASPQEMRKVQERDEGSGDRERGKNQKTGSEDTRNQRGEKPERGAWGVRKAGRK